MPILPPCRKGSQHLHQWPWDAQPTTMSKRLNTYINDHGRPSLPPCRKGSRQLHQWTLDSHPATMLERLSTFVNDHGRAILPPCQKGSCVSLSLRGNLDLKNTKILSEVLKLHSGTQLGQHIIYLLIFHNILELHFSSIHHIPDIVILDLDMLWLVMEH